MFREQGLGRRVVRVGSRLRRWRWLAVVVGGLIIIFEPVLAQNATGRILGTLRDPQSAAVSGAKVKVTSAGTKASRETVSGPEGTYLVLDLPAGNYIVTVEHEGFKRVVTSPQTLEIDQTLRIDVRLELGPLTETVTTAAEAPQVETLNPTIGATVAGPAIQNLPLNGRDTLQLALTLPGIASAPTSPFAATGAPTGIFSAGGARDNAVTYLLDGGNNTSVVHGVPIVDPNRDTVAEFRVLTNNYSAEYGRSAGGVVSIVTKSGSTAFHGSVFNYLRNTALDANGLFNKLEGRARSELERNQFGGTIGGPLLRRLFFFAGYQGQRQTQDLVNPEITVFTPAELRGDFSGDAGVAAFLQTHPRFQSNLALAAQGVIDPTKIDPVAVKYIAAGLIPAAPSGSLAPTGPAVDNRDEYLGKIDFYATPKNRFTLTLVRSHNPQPYPFLSPGLGPDVSGFPGFNQFDNYFGSLGLTTTISPTALNEFRMTAQHSKVKLNYPAAQLPGPAQLGFLDTSGNPSIRPDLVNAPPQLVFANSNLQLGFNLFGPVDYGDTTYGYSDALTWIRGRHALKAGGSFNVLQNNIQSGYLVDGQFVFAGGASGIDLADFLLGLPDAFIQGERGVNAIRSHQYSGFFQDQWKLTRRLVLTLGLRYEYSTPKTDPKGRTETIIPGLQSQRYPNAPLGLVFPGDPGTPRGVTFPDRHNWAPRFGFAWDPRGDGKTSLRGGFGVFYDILLGLDNEYETGGPPFSSVAYIGCLAPCHPSVSTVAPYSFLSNPYGASGTPNPFPSSSIRPQQLDFAKAGFLPFGPSSGFSDPNERTPYVYQYNLSLQRQVAPGIAAELGYLGTSSRKLTAWVDQNPILPGTSTYRLNTQPGLQIPNAFSSMPYTSVNGANASYNGMAASLTKRLDDADSFGRSFFTLSYTWSHEIDDADGLFRSNQQVPYYNQHQFRSSGAIDVRSRLVLSGGWSPPLNRLGRNRKSRLTTGWSLYSILAAHSGLPIDVNAGLPVLGEGIPGPSGAGDQNLVRPNIVRPVRQLDPSYVQTFRVNGQPVTGHFLFDPNSLANPPCYSSFAIPGSGASGACAAPTYGTLPRNAFRGPGRVNLDVALDKKTQLWNERAELTFRAEFFNALNQTQFQNPVGPVSVGSPLLGQITSAFDPRIGQLSLRLSY